MAGDKITGEYLLNRMDGMERRILESIASQYKSLDERVDKVEGFQNRVLGMAAVFSSFVGLASTYIWNKITNNS